ncbi:ACP S-malonyltransferase [Yaniella halotolerans]|uniref:ACP S-malonyltransferase n=1 Tax=Yaniella halotolerans TaxID=225453 RepID=UPI0003B59687|nr:ACP S-malonyltransferase [Yaniella halotolerans]
MLAIVCPGQGSQTPGFLEPWLELPGISEALNEWSEATKVDLVTHGTTSDEDTIKDTAVAQPLIVAAGLLAAQAMGTDQLDQQSWMTAGHSVGEITAAGLASVFSPVEALEFVRVRAQGMASAAAVEPTGMAAVLGGDQDEVIDYLEDMDITPANVNGGGQVVAAASQDALAKLAQDPLDKTRVIELKVAGAFHTKYMAPAVADLQAFAETLNPNDPSVALASNSDGTVIDSGQLFVERLINQVTSPVRWDLCQQTMVDQGVTGIIELLPGGTLTGIARRAMKGVKTLAIKKPEDLDKAQDFIAEHTQNISA